LLRLYLQVSTDTFNSNFVGRWVMQRIHANAHGKDAQKNAEECWLVVQFTHYLFRTSIPVPGDRTLKLALDYARFVIHDSTISQFSMDIGICWRQESFYKYDQVIFNEQHEI